MDARLGGGHGTLGLGGNNLGDFHGERSQRWLGYLARRISGVEISERAMTQTRDERETNPGGDGCSPPGGYKG
jgi:hypothetical protein